MKFRTKIWMLPLSAGAMFLLGVALSFAVGARTSELLYQQRTVDTPALAKLQQLDRDVEALRLNLQTAAAEGDASSLNKVHEVDKLARQHLAELAALKDRKSQADRLGVALARYAEAALEATQAMLARADAGERMARMQALQAALAEMLSQAIAEASATVKARDEAAEAGVRLASWVTLGTGLLVLVVLGLASRLIVRAVWRELGEDPAVLSHAVSRVAEGDLSQVLPVAAGDTDSTWARVAAMQAGLARVVAEVRSNADSVATASAEIAQGNLDLSERTEQQAAALQQTAATMKQLSSTVQHNAEGAKQARQLAVKASAVASQGGAVVSQVVGMMQGISDSSGRIRDIIGVIDGIAFQTNILALNAAVEAARAGELGRGFAVVAGEVRNLAQRSAEAAREIKALIGHSVGQVEQGSVLVGQAGATMDEIVSSIRRVTDIVSEITEASLQQSDGIAQVGDAVGQMDQATQQNAALVEESAAAAESLKAQAQQLVQAVAVFRLGSDAQAAVTERRQVGADRPATDGAATISPASRLPRPGQGATSVAASPPAVPAASPSDDEWTSF